MCAGSCLRTLAADGVPFVRLARMDEIPPGRTLFTRIGSKPILIANVAGQFFAVHGLCPHRNNPLDGATLLGPLIDCPWHHFQYDVRTGENHFPRNVYPSDMPQLQAQLGSLRVYQVDVRDQEIWIDVE
jgi:3-phenylpropionate/trans-cinnamate dioxygenase ferredoxin subunit